MKIAIIEYGIGNIKSVYNVFTNLGINVLVVSDGTSLKDFNPTHIVLPGVGAVGEALSLLRLRGFEDVLNYFVKIRKIPFLGICVGMQILAERCEEFGLYKGLGWIGGDVKKLKISNEYKLPHIGWNTINTVNKKDLLLANCNEKDFYFVHSYAMQCDKKYVLSFTDYGVKFISSIKKENIYGVQFHPEKSSIQGERVLKAFIAI